MHIESTSVEASKCLNMSVEVFVPRLEIDMINDWLEGHNLDHISPKILPETGFLLCEDDTAVACVFMFKDGGKGWIEGCLANPYEDKGKVAKNFEFALEYIELYAKSIGVESLTIFTSIFGHAKKFINNGYTMINRCVALEKELI